MNNVYLCRIIIYFRFISTFYCFVLIATFFSSKYPTGLYADKRKSSIILLKCWEKAQIHFFFSNFLQIFFKLLKYLHLCGMIFRKWSVSSFSSYSYLAKVLHVQGCNWDTDNLDITSTYIFRYFSLNFLKVFQLVLLFPSYF